jgi:hypothetical protein
MSGSPGNTSSGGSGRTPRGTNDDLIQRHGAGGPDSTARTDATTDARGPGKGKNDRREPDPDAPQDDDA